MQKKKLGIVLSGGGAKGAYEVGFLKALSEFGIQPHAVSGASIGALNGAIYAALGDTTKSALILEKLWNDLAHTDTLKLDTEKVIKNIVDVLTYFSPMPVSRLTKVVMTAMKAGKSQEGLLSQIPMIDRLKQYACVEELKKGLPFYVGMTKSHGNLQDVANYFELGKEEVVFKKIQNLKDEEIHKAIMASAALPILFDGLEIEGEIYRDGCLGSTENQWGNTPAKPLVTDEKCTHLIVCHLGNGSFF
ncbi:MAG: hypothetical protein KU38_03535 [Sulfurovum sp. FS08-3]|nr:MAG: hypothetical protein KU38_03535 [Sulfurovum sp. FS08-3]